jgi:hypothetical protein
MSASRADKPPLFEQSEIGLGLFRKAREFGLEGRFKASMREP